MDWLKIAQQMAQKGLDADKIKEMSKLLKENPMAALDEAQKLNLDPQLIQQVAGLLRQNPGVFKAMAKMMGFDEEQLKNLERMAEEWGQGADAKH